jgi:hypothetical protein
VPTVCSRMSLSRLRGRPVKIREASSFDDWAFLAPGSRSSQLGSALSGFPERTCRELPIGARNPSHSQALFQ